MTPKSNPLTADALSLATDALEVSIDAKENVVTKDEWNRVAYYHLIQARRTLAGVHILVSNGIVDPAGILLRHLFELAVTVRYLHGRRDQVPAFVQYYSGESLPTRAWGNLKQMCESLDLLLHYDEMYRLLSEQAHGGVAGMGQEYLRLLRNEPMPDWNAAAVMASAVVYYEWIIQLVMGPPLDANWSGRMTVLMENVREEQRAYLKGQGITPPY